MFIETHADKDTILTFIKSANVQAYPCGRRRSTEIDKDRNLATTTDKYVFPFDPEARLNTEANNRKHSSLNGYTQTYLKDWNESEKLLTLALNGYLFTISLVDDYKDYKTTSNFGTEVINTLSAKALAFKDAVDNDLSSDENDKKTAGERYNAIITATKIYANILLEQVHLFSGFQDYYTEILRNQSESVLGLPETSLDLICASSNNLEGKNNFENYYFSGLSFSATPLTEDKEKSYSIKPIEPLRDPVNGTTVKQTIVSLCFLEKRQDKGETVATWKVYEPARLPHIKHGTNKNSVVLGDTLIQKTTKLVANPENPNENIKEIINNGNLTVENHTKSKTIEATENITTPDLDVTTLATIKEADIETADINALTGVNATITNITGTTVKADVFEQKVNEQYRPVPYIALQEQTDGTYQLQITRIEKFEIED